jgi:L-2-hydroxyglutarate oxidase LhgO
MSQTAVIIGAGIVGLHIANVLKEKGYEVYVLDKEPYLAEHTSGRNSGVIHAGIFYKTDSFKEQVCIEGNRLTYEWLLKLSVSHRNCGKWVVPEPGQEGQIDEFFAKVQALPIPEPKILSATEVKTLEPNLRNTEAILIPSTGILDAAEYVKTMANYLETQGVMIVLNCEVEGVKENQLLTTRGEIPYDIAINCAGLFSDEIAKQTGLNDYEIKPCRGDYYLLNSNPLSKPVYHLPYKNSHGLGVHLTPTLDNQTLIGPNAFFIDSKSDYDHHSDLEAYSNSVNYYLPEIKNPNIQLAYTGNRPKLFKNGEALPLFTFEKQDNWIHLLGIESPGLTSAPALAKHFITLL